MLGSNEALNSCSLKQKEINVQTKASPSAEEIAEVKRKTAMTKERMLTGAFVKAYSKPVIDAKISLNAMRT